MSGMLALMKLFFPDTASTSMSIVGQPMKNSNRTVLLLRIPMKMLKMEMWTILLKALPVTQTSTIRKTLMMTQMATNLYTAVSPKASSQDSAVIANQAEIDSFKSRKNLAASIIIQGISDAIMTELMGCLDDPRRVWSILEAKFNSATSSKILSILTSIMNMDLNTFSLKLETLYCQLVNIETTNGEKVEVTGDVFKSCMALSYMKNTGNYEAVVESIRGTGGADHKAPTYEEVKHRLVEACIELKSDRRDTSNLYGRYEKRFGGRHDYHRQGGRDSRANFVKKEDMECYFCHKKGHMKSDCYANPESKNYRGDRNNGAKGKSKVGSSGRNKQTIHASYAVVCPSSPPESKVLTAMTTRNERIFHESGRLHTNFQSKATLTKAQMNEKRFENPLTAEARPTVILDSGATNHICSDRRLLAGLLTSAHARSSWETGSISLSLEEGKCDSRTEKEKGYFSLTFFTAPNLSSMSFLSLRFLEELDGIQISLMVALKFAYSIELLCHLDSKRMDCTSSMLDITTTPSMKYQLCRVCCCI